MKAWFLNNLQTVKALKVFKDFPVFLRYYLQATKQMVTKDSLFKVVKQYVKVNSDVFDGVMLICLGSCLNKSLNSNH